MSYEYAVYSGGRRATGFTADLASAEASYEERVGLLKREGYAEHQVINDRRSWHVSTTLGIGSETVVINIVRFKV